MADLAPRTLAAATRVRAAARERARRRMVLRVATAQVREPCVLVLTPDFDHPSAGVRTMYRHVDVLRSAGVPAEVLHHRPGFRCTWFASDTPVSDLATREIGPEDLLVVGELDVDLVARNVARGRPVRHVVLDQSGYLAWDHAPAEVARHYASHHRPLAVLATSRHVAEVAAFAHPGMEVRHVRLGLDVDRFRPVEEPAPGARRISYMPRRNGTDVDLALRLLSERGTLDGWEVHALDGIGADEVAARLQHTQVFLSVSHREGFGMPPLEAMACGAYVVGYDGLGGREFLTPDLACPVETGNVLELARALDRVLAAEAAEPGWLRRRGLAAAASVRAAYSPERERESVLAGYAGLLGADAGAGA